MNTAESWKNVIGQNGVWAGGYTGERSRACLSRFLSASWSWRQGAPFLWVWGGRLSQEALWPSGRRWGGSKRLSWLAIFSDSFSSKYSLCKDAIFWGSKFWTLSLVFQNVSNCDFSYPFFWCHLSSPYIETPSKLIPLHIAVGMVFLNINYKLNYITCLFQNLNELANSLLPTRASMIWSPHLWLIS